MLTHHYAGHDIEALTGTRRGERRHLSRIVSVRRRRDWRLSGVPATVGEMNQWGSQRKRGGVRTASLAHAGTVVDNLRPRQYLQRDPSGC